jgi:putative NIF3 family GTP cyclohydrolase 1 type 2
MSVALNDIAAFLQKTLLTDRFPAKEQGGIFRPSERRIRRLGVALEPSPQLTIQVRSQVFDALWLHRPWRLDLGTLPPDMGILYHHLPFDERLTMGYNPLLAERLGLEWLDELGYKYATDEAGNALPPRPIGMLGTSLPRPFYDWKTLIQQQFGGFDKAGDGLVYAPGRVAIVGAMNTALVQEAHERGAELYLTGAYRPGAQAAVAATGMSVIAVGHERTEAWGLRALAKLLRVQWPETEIV